MNYTIHPDIRKAETLPGSFYKDAAVFELLRERIFRTTWHFIENVDLNNQYASIPVDLLEGFLQEPLLITKNSQDKIECLSNVCTHRANLLVHEPKKSSSIVCAYHGRKFNLDGKFLSMPEFGEAENFPRECDHLRRFPLENLGDHLFTSIDPKFDFSKIADPINERIGFLPLSEFQYRADLSKNYLVNAHWALYCDNYLEGFHIPFVHKDLNAVLDYKNYETILFDYCNLQVGYSAGGEEIFNLPKNHIDYGKKIAAYYFWVFPNMMFNFYPWGLSLNIVSPLTKNKTKVKFLTYVYDESKLEQGAGAMLDKVEREDEFVVEGVHKGLQSSSYSTGRFSPTREKGVHHFHSLLANFISD